MITTHYAIRHKLISTYTIISVSSEQQFNALSTIIHVVIFLTRCLNFKLPHICTRGGVGPKHDIERRRGNTLTEGTDSVTFNSGGHITKVEKKIIPFIMKQVVIP